MTQNRCIEVGEDVPDFILKDQNNKEFKLSDFKGKKVLLSFHPLAWTAFCGDQMQSIEKNWDQFKEFNTVAVGISVDTIASKKAWADTLNIKNVRLLSDFWPHGRVAELYGIFRQKDGFSERANILIDENQKISFVGLYKLAELPDIKKIINIFKTER